MGTNLKEQVLLGIKLIFAHILYYCGITGLILRICLKINPARIIIMYHRIIDNNNGVFLGVNLVNFDKQVSMLKKYFGFVVLSELIESKKNVKTPLATITFDDGIYASFKIAKYQL